MSGTLRFIALLALATGMFIYPQDVVSSALDGMNLWWRYVLPALFPFLVLSELLIGGGFVHLLGSLTEPLMRPLFRLPGSASFVVAMGYTSGFPMGAILTARLRQQGALSREEGERLLAFTNNPSPGFIFGAVSSGMLGRPELGVLLAASVYLANLTIGFLSRFRHKSTKAAVASSFSWRQAWEKMHQAQKADQRSFGQLLSEAVRQSMTTVLAVGGFIIFFAVLIRLLTLWHIPAMIAALLKPLLGSAITPEGIEAMVNGLMEMTLGCQGAISGFSQLNSQIAVIALMMGWGGISVFAQIAGLISTTDLRFSGFALARLGHAALALIYSQIFLFFFAQPTAAIPVPPSVIPVWLHTLQLSSNFFIFNIIILGLLALAFRLRILHK